MGWSTMVRLHEAPSVDSTLLFQEEGGLAKDLKAKLEVIAKELETVGWASCSMGAHPKLLERAMQEADLLRDKMAPGTTVIRNETVTDTTDPRAHRGDKLLFM